MSWWNEALFDTCSLISVDKMLLDDPTLIRFFPLMRTIDICLDRDNLRPSTADRIRSIVTIEELPPLEVTLGSTENLPMALSETDRLLYATALFSGRPVVTGDKCLAKALLKAGIAVANLALIFRDLVNGDQITPAACVEILTALDAREDYIIPRPQTWERLERHRFP